MLLASHKIKTGKAIILYELLVLFVLLILFSWFIHVRYPLRLISFFALLFVAFIISNHHQFVKDSWQQIKSGTFSNRMIVYNLIGLQLGVLIAIYFRFSSQMNVLPQSFHWFVITGIAIAITEELLFRGVVQPMAENINYYSAPVVAALMHSVYKAMIFVPLAGSNPDITSLFVGSFIAYIGLGYLKQFSGSILPPVIVHVVFDILVYAEYTKAPWWVW